MAINADEMEALLKQMELYTPKQMRVLYGECETVSVSAWNLAQLYDKAYSRCYRLGHPSKPIRFKSRIHEDKRRFAGNIPRGM